MYSPTYGALHMAPVPVKLHMWKSSWQSSKGIHDYGQVFQLAGCFLACILHLVLLHS